MNKPKKNRLVWIIAIFIFCLLCIVVSFLATYIFQLRLEPTYHLEDVKMVSCKSFETQMCSADTVTFYSAGEDNDICVAWVEVGRKQYDSLAIVIYDKSNKAVFSYEDVQSPSSIQSRACKSMSIDTISGPGDYRTEFVISGRPFQSPVLWSIK